MRSEFNPSSYTLQLIKGQQIIHQEELLDASKLPLTYAKSISRAESCWQGFVKDHNQSLVERLGLNLSDQDYGDFTMVHASGFMVLTYKLTDNSKQKIVEAAKSGGALAPTDFAYIHVHAN